MSFDILTISNELGESRDYQWPTGSLLLANTGFVDVHVAEFVAEFPHSENVSISLSSGSLFLDG